MALAILHREPSATPEPAGLTWRTCLREVEFVEFADDAGPFARGARLEEGAAYAMLLEILCGLQSPMLGETQVMGQFKSFLGGLGPDQAWLNRLGQRLLGDAKTVRAKHLSNLGSRSYGSAIRRYLGDSTQTVLIGTGKLAQEVLPFLSENGRRVDHWGRSETVVPVGGPVVYHALDAWATQPISQMPTTLVIAAPAPPEVIEAVAGRYALLRRVIDLRADFGERPLSVSAPVVTLQDLFDRMRATQSSSNRQLEAARAEIAWCSRRYDARDELRPFGWDDLCA